MPKAEYPPNWKDVATQVKEDAGWRCIRCKHPHENPGHHIKCDMKCDLVRHPEIRGVEHIDNEDGTAELRLDWVSGQKQRVLTVHHLDGNKWNLQWWNLTALCQVCHLIIQAKVNMFRPWAMFEHSEWFKPYAAGFYAHRYLGESLSRQEVVERMSELLALEGPLTFPTWKKADYIDPEQNFIKD